MTVLLGAARSIIGPSEIGAWMAAKGAPGAAALLDFAGGRYGFRSPDGRPRWGSLAGDLAFSRASAGGRLPAAGPYEMVASNVLRLDHDPVTRAPLGARIEAAASPISQGTAVWSATGSSWLQTVAFPAINTKISLFADGVAAEHVSSGASSQARGQSRPVTAGTNYRVDVIVERTANSHTRVHYGLHSGGWLGLLGYDWTTDAHTVTAIDYSAATSMIVEQLGIGPNGGKMVRLSCVINVLTATSAILYVYPNGLSGSTAGQSCIIHYGCVTPTVLYPSPLVVPVGATQARAADSLVSPLYCTPSEAFTLAVRLRMPMAQNSGDSNTLFSMVAPSGIADRISISSYGPNGLNLGATYSNVLAFNSLYYGGAAPDNVVAVSWSPAKKYRASCLGQAVTKIAVATPPPANLSRITWGSRAGAAIWGGTIVRAAIWAHDDFSDDELRGLLA